MYIIYIIIVGTHRLYLYVYGMDVIIIPEKKKKFFFHTWEWHFFKASLMFQVENCDPAATPVLARPKDSSAFENTLATCVLKLMPMAVQSHFWEKSQMNKQRRKQTQIGEMMNHNTTMKKKK